MPTTSIPAPVAKPARRQSSALWGLPAEILLTSKIGQAITPSNDSNGTWYSKYAISDCPVIMVSFHENHTAIWFPRSEAEVVPQAKKKRKKVVKRVQVLLNP